MTPVLKNPLLLDPSRTTALRRSFQADMLRRLAKLKSALWKLIVEDDVFGLRERKPFKLSVNDSGMSCFPAFTPVDGAFVMNAFRRFYEGPMVHIETSKGRKFSCTPNHPVLTNRGWVSAGTLNNTDYLICNTGSQKHERFSSFGFDVLSTTFDPDIQGRPSLISEIFDSLSAIGISKWTNSEPDFHGDGFNGHVDVSSSDRVLSFGVFSPLTKEFVHSVLPFAYWSALAFCSDCHCLLTNDSDCLCKCSDGDTNSSQSVVDAGDIHIVTGSDGRAAFTIPISTCNFFDVSFKGSVELVRNFSSADVGDYISYAVNRKCSSVGYLPVAQSLPVELDNVVSVSISQFSGHVYNLQTRDGYYSVAEGVYVCNCNAFGHRQQTTRLRLNTRFKFLTDPDKLDAFNKWFANEVQKGILQVDHNGQPWTAKYVDSAYKKGRVRAYMQARKEDLSKSEDWLAGTREQFLRSAFDQPEVVSKLRLLGTRNFEQLKGITADMSSQLNRILASGIAGGKAPREIARQISKEVDGIGRKRALVLARTEIIHAHAVGQLQAFEEMGVEGIQVLAEFLTAGDRRVCPRCSSLSGKVFTIKQAYGLIPQHPNCRCCFTASRRTKPSNLTRKQKQEADIEEEQPAPEPVAPAPKPAKPPKIPKTVADFAEKMAANYNVELRATDEQLPLAKHIDKQLSHLKQKYPTLAKYMDSGKKRQVLVLSPDTNVGSQKAKADGIYLPSYGIKLAAGKDLVLHDLTPQMGQYVVGGDFNCIFRHEYGHQTWWDWLPSATRREFETKFDKYVGVKEHYAVSVYATTNIEELFCECFAAYTSPKYFKGLLPADLDAWFRGYLE